MSEYKRPNFDGNWWESVEDYLKKHPEEGFDPEDAKQFIKVCTNRYMKSSEENHLNREKEKLSAEEIKAVKDLIQNKD
jgi:hypothetical protein